MTDYIPSVIQIKIFCHLPVKSLIRFRSVSKEWKSLIDSSKFNSDYTLGQMKQKRFLLKVYKGMNLDDPEYRGKGDSYWLVEDDDVFPQNKISLSYPRSFNQLLNKHGLWYNNVFEFVGSSHGLLCFTGCYVGEVDDCFNRYVIWNPSIRKSITIDALYYEHVNAGFGVCPNSLDPKIVRIIKFYVPYCNVEHKLKNWVWRVEVFTLSEGVWRSPLIKLPSKWVGIVLKSETPVVLNGFIYWYAIDYVGECYTIISFNLATEEFTKMQLPDELAHRDSDDMFKLFNLRGSLGAVQSDTVYESEYSTDRKEVHAVWLMDHVSKLFTKVFSVTLPDMCKVVGFRDNKHLIIEKIDDFKGLENGIYQYVGEIVGYERYSEQFNKLIGLNVSEFVASYPHSEEFTKLGLDFGFYSFTSYTESLLLLDQSNALNDDQSGADIASF